MRCPRAARKLAMPLLWYALAGAFAVSAAACGCSSAAPAPDERAATAVDPTGQAGSATGEVVGVTDKETIEAAVPAWRTAREAATPDPEASRALAQVEPGARLDVVLGTWCGDSQREVPRLFRAFELAGDLPFEVRIVGVDRAKEDPDGLVDDLDVEYVPTLIVYRDGSEVGRIVESAPEGVEVALLSLLRGERTGVVTGREDL